MTTPKNPAVPKALAAHAKKNGMTVTTDARGIATYQKKGRDLISFNLADADVDPAQLIKVLDKSIAAMKGGK